MAVGREQAHHPTPDADGGDGLVPVSFALSPHQEALAEAGRQMLVESVNTGREFCKFMIGVATGAVPVYLGLLEFSVPDRSTLGVEERTAALLPVVALLVAAVLFALGYLPTTGRMSLDVLEDVERERSTTIQRRDCFGKWGFGFFVFGVLSGSVATMAL